MELRGLKRWWDGYARLFSQIMGRDRYYKLRDDIVEVRYIQTTNDSRGEAPARSATSRKNLGTVLHLRAEVGLGDLVVSKRETDQDNCYQTASRVITDAGVSGHRKAATHGHFKPAPIKCP